MFKIPEFIKYALISLLAVFLNASCATFQFGPSLGPLEEIVLEGEGPEKILLVDVRGIITKKTVLLQELPRHWGWWNGFVK